MVFGGCVMNYDGYEVLCCDMVGLVNNFCDLKIILKVLEDMYYYWYDGLVEWFVGISL